MPKTDKPNYRVRRETHNKQASEHKARKKIRGVRAEIHEAMLVAAAMKRSKKKGMTDVDANMEQLGFARMSPNTDPRNKPYPVEVKYVKVEA